MVMLNGNFLAIVFSLAFSYKAAPLCDLHGIGFIDRDIGLLHKIFDNSPKVIKNNS